MMMQLRTRILLWTSVAAIAAAGANAQDLAKGQSLPPRELSASQVKTIRAQSAEERQAVTKEHNIKLRDINDEWQRQRDELSVENSRVRREIQNEWSRKLREIGAQELSSADKKSKRTEIDAEKDKLFSEQLQSYNEKKKQIDADREQYRAAQIAANGEMLVQLQIDTDSRLDGISPDAGREANTTTEAESTADSDQSEATEPEEEEPLVSGGETERTADSLVHDASRSLTMRGMGNTETTVYPPIVLTVSTELTMTGLGETQTTIYEPINITVSTPLTMRGADR